MTAWIVATAVDTQITAARPAQGVAVEVKPKLLKDRASISTGEAELPDRRHSDRGATPAATSRKINGSPGQGEGRASCNGRGRGKIVLIDKQFNTFDRYTGGHGYLGGEGYWAASLQHILQTLGYDVEQAVDLPRSNVSSLVSDLRAGRVHRVIFSGGARQANAKSGRGDAGETVDVFSDPEAACRVRTFYWWGLEGDPRGLGPFSPGWGRENVLVPFKPRPGDCKFQAAHCPEA